MNYLTLSYLSGDKLLIKLSLYKGLSYIEKVSYFSYFSELYFKVKFNKYNNYYYHYYDYY